MGAVWLIKINIFNQGDFFKDIFGFIVFMQPPIDKAKR
jgi:hypothetical protein